MVAWQERTTLLIEKKIFHPPFLVVSSLFSMLRTSKNGLKLPHFSLSLSLFCINLFSSSHIKMNFHFLSQTYFPYTSVHKIKIIWNFESILKESQWCLIKYTIIFFKKKTNFQFLHIFKNIYIPDLLTFLEICHSLTNYFKFKFSTFYIYFLLRLFF